MLSTRLPRSNEPPPKRRTPWSRSPEDKVRAYGTGMLAVAIMPIGPGKPRVARTHDVMPTFHNPTGHTMTVEQQLDRRDRGVATAISPPIAGGRNKCAAEPSALARGSPPGDAP